MCYQYIINNFFMLIIVIVCIKGFLFKEKNKYILYLLYKEKGGQIYEYICIATLYV